MPGRKTCSPASRPWRNHHGSILSIDDKALDNASPARSFDDYVIKLDSEGLPDGIEMLDMV